MSPSPSRDGLSPDEGTESQVAFVKGPKRKRLAKACDACHKSKRRCDGTSPCGNCYYASKQCTYTDSAGRPVPAPRERAEPHAGPPPSSASSSSSVHYPDVRTPNALEEDDNARKRHRPSPLGMPGSLPPLLAPPLIPENGRPHGPAPVDLDPALARELVNLFFTHSQPYRLFIHKPTFMLSLARGALPRYLLLGVCCNSAPLSKQPRLRTTPARCAGEYFAQEATDMLFDRSGRLQLPLDLSVVQTLCLLWIHDFKNKGVAFHYHDLALQSLRTLGLHSVEEEIAHKDSLERECMRRIYWHIHCTNIRNAIYFRQPLAFNIRESTDIRLRLPVDETSFDLANETLPLPEYLYQAPPKDRDPSEYGLYVRILTVYSNIEHLLHPFSGKDSIANPAGMLLQAEEDVKAWGANLPEYLRFNDETLEVQLSMFETNANTGAWCYFAMHVYHASCVLAINYARQFYTRGPKSEPQWTVAQLDKIAGILGYRARNSFLLAAIIWSLKKYANHTTPQMRQWAQEIEDYWGVDMLDQAAKTPAPPPSLSSNPHVQSVYEGAAGFYPLGFKDPTSAPPAILPSLKSSGLLDWNGQQRAVPVGLPWLANESSR